VVQVKQP